MLQVRTTRHHPFAGFVTTMLGAGRTSIVRVKSSGGQQHQLHPWRRTFATLNENVPAATAAAEEEDTTTSTSSAVQQTTPSEHPSNNNINDNYDCYIPVGSMPLGAPLPTDEHACSVSLPTWQAVVGYEEGDPAVTTAMKCGYPRFVYHPTVLQLMDCILEHYGKKHQQQRDSSSSADGTTTTTTTTTHLAEDCLVLPTAAAAARCQAFLQQALEGKRNGVDNALMEQAPEEEAAAAAQESSAATTRTMIPSSPPPPLYHHEISSRIRRISLPAECNVHAVLFPAETLAGMEAKAYWQHTGEIVSSRRAEHAMLHAGWKLQHHVTGEPVIRKHCFQYGSDNDGNTVRNNNNNNRSSRCGGVHDQLRERIAKWARVPDKHHVFLAPSGMASIYKALRSARRYQMECGGSEGGGTSIVYGFPYLDTLKACSRSELSPDGVEFFGRGDARDLESLEQMLLASSRPGGRNRTFSALFTEVPSNPLLKCPDLYKLRELADRYNFCLIVDDTISNFLNVDMIGTGLADAVCSSLTKLVSGRGDAMAGSLVVNPGTEKGRWMQQDLLLSCQREEQDPLSSHALFPADAHAVLVNSTDFVERNERINATSEALADWLLEHPAIQTVYYPKGSPLYDQVKIGGYGGLMSLLLHPHMCQRTFFDALDIPKGPSLGTNFTLMCPYTLLAHYHELDFAMNYNVPPNLLRLAVGLEPLEELQDKFERAFAKSQLHPKICMDPQQRRAFSTDCHAFSAAAATTTTKPAAARLSSHPSGLSRSLVRSRVELARRYVSRRLIR